MQLKMKKIKKTFILMSEISILVTFQAKNEKLYFSGFLSQNEKVLPKFVNFWHFFDFWGGHKKKIFPIVDEVKKKKLNS